MNSYEVICAAIEFRTPNRLPVIIPKFGMWDTH